MLDVVNEAVQGEDTRVRLRLREASAAPAPYYKREAPGPDHPFAAAKLHALLGRATSCRTFRRNVPLMTIGGLSKRTRCIVQACVLSRPALVSPGGDSTPSKHEADRGKRPRASVAGRAPAFQCVRELFRPLEFPSRLPPPRSARAKSRVLEWAVNDAEGSELTRTSMRSGCPSQTAPFIAKRIAKRIASLRRSGGE